MTKNNKKQEKSHNIPPPASAAIASYPHPPAMKAEDYLTAYKGYAYTAISSIANEVASIDLHLFRIKRSSRGIETEEVHDHPAKTLLHQANPFMTAYDLYEATAIYEELVGEAFWIVIREGDGGLPHELYPVRPDWVKVVPDPEKFIKEYHYCPSNNIAEKIIIPPENMIHFKYFNPISPYRGRGTIQAGAMPLDIHNFMNEWNRNLFFNNALPSAVFTTEKRVGQKVLDRFIKQWQATYGGRANAHKVAFLTGGFKLEKISQTAKELDFANQQAMIRDDVLAVFKVPKTVLGLTDDVNKANAQATTRAFMERVITPRMKKFVGQLNEFYLPMFGDTDQLFFDFTDPSPEDVDMKMDVYDNALKYGWMTVNEVRANENLEPLEGGDDVSVTDEEGQEKTMSAIKHGKLEKVRLHKPDTLIKNKHMMLIPPKTKDAYERDEIKSSIQGDVYKVVAKLLKGESDKPVFDKDPTISWTKEEREAYWRVFGERADDREADMKAMLRVLWLEEEKEILNGLDNLKYWRKEYRKAKGSSALPKLEDMNKRWASVFIPFMRAIVIEEGQTTLDFLGVGGNLDMTTDNAVEFIRQHGAELVNEINKGTRKKMSRVIADGLAKEDSISDIKQSISKVFEEQIKGKLDKKTKKRLQSRSEKIARTEVIRASNFATEEAYIQSGVVIEKEWLTSRDGRVCQFCDTMEDEHGGKRVKVGKPFFKEGDTVTGNEGGKLDVSLLDVDTPPLHPQCRCTLIPVIADK